MSETTRKLDPEAGLGLFESLAGLMQDGVLAAGPSSRILFANRAVERLLGRPANDLAGRSFAQLVAVPGHDSASEDPEASWRRLREGGRITARTEEGTAVTFEASWTELAAPQGPLWIGLFRDPEILRRSETSGSEERRRARARSRALEALSAASRQVVDGTDLRVMLNRIVSFVQERFAMPMVQIVLLDEDGTHFTVHALAPENLAGIRIGQRWPTGQGGVVGNVLRSGVVRLIRDVRNHPEYVEVDPTVRAELALPLKRGSEAFGVLNLEAEDPELFSQETCQILEAVADQVAGAVHLARAYRQLRRTADQLAEANTELAKLNSQLALLSRTDDLTGAANRRHFREVLDLEWRRAVRSAQPLSLLLVDVDQYKRYNDTYGHESGDMCLRRIAECLGGQVTRAGELLARWGGDEFVAVVPNADRRLALRLADRMRRAVRGLGIPHAANTAAQVVTVSIGHATRIPRRGIESESLVQEADRSLYEAKRLGRNQVGTEESPE